MAERVERVCRHHGLTTFCRAHGTAKQAWRCMTCLRNYTREYMRLRAAAGHAPKGGRTTRIITPDADPWDVYTSRRRDDAGRTGAGPHYRSGGHVVGRHLAESGDGFEPGDEFSTSADRWKKVYADAMVVLLHGGRLVSSLAASSPKFVARMAELGVEVVAP